MRVYVRMCVCVCARVFPVRPQNERDTVRDKVPVHLLDAAGAVYFFYFLPLFCSFLLL